MSLFHYQGRDKTGKKIDGDLEAASVDDVIKYLNKQNIIPISVDLIRSNQKGLLSLLKYEIHFGGVKKQEILSFCEQMAILINAGIPVIRAVKQLAKSSKSKRLSDALYDVANGLDSGQTLHATLRKHKEIFSDILVSLVEVGETTGKLFEVFSQLSNLIETEITSKKRLFSALRYPAIVIIAIVAAIFIVNIFVIPKFSDIFLRFKKTLPAPTRMLIGVSNLMQHHWGLVLILIIVAYFSFRFLLTIPKFRYWWDYLKISFPVIGDLQNRILLSQFAWTFSLILRTGVPVIKGMTLIASTVDNSFLAKKIYLVRDAIEKGSSFSVSVANSQLFDSTALQMIGVGEEIGKLDDMLEKVAKYYEKEVDYDIKRLNDLIEPIILVVLGLMVVVLALGIYLPMWDLIKVAKV